jgi:adenosylcobinamide kinase/adenosylcobinamide-phosphate guanylyltransferase
VLIDGVLDFPAIPDATPDATPDGERGSAPGYQVRPVTGGQDITGPDRQRLLLAAGPGQVPEPPAGARPYDLALLDLLGSPAQLGRLRSAGLVHDRIRSEPELARRCQLWAVRPGQDGLLISTGAGLAGTHAAATGSSQAEPPARLPRPHRTLLIGGGRSGKSSEAELRLAAEPAVTYVAAGPFAPDTAATPPDRGPDPEWDERVARHRARRPPWWRTVETLDIAGLLRQETGALLIDGIGTWLAAVLAESGMWADPDRPAGPDSRSADLVRARIDALVAAWRQTSALVVAVTDQVGSGLVPAYHAGRLFRDQLGWLNQRLAAESELNLQVVAGRVITLPG